jgi:hypothetical protein
VKSIYIHPADVCRLVIPHVRAGTCQDFSLAVIPSTLAGLACVPNDVVDEREWPLALPLGDILDPEEEEGPLIGATDARIQRFLVQPGVLGAAMRHMEHLLAIEGYSVRWAGGLPT